MYIQSVQSFIQCKQEYKELQSHIIEQKQELAQCEKKLHELYQIQPVIGNITQPDYDPISYDDIMHYELYNNTKLQKLEKHIQEDESCLAYLYDELNKIKLMEISLHTCVNELNVFQNSHEYEYNPKCHYCCKRPWVSKMKELEIQKVSLQKDIQQSYDLLFDKCPLDYLYIYMRNEDNKRILAWFNYHTHQDICTILSAQMQLKSNLQQFEDKACRLQDYIIDFVNRAHVLYHSYLYHTYTKWKQLNEEVSELQKNIVYLPRKQKLAELKQAYIAWSEYKRKLEIINASKMVKIKHQISAYENAKEYNDYKRMKPIILRKKELISAINDIDCHINEVIKNQTVAAYYNANKNNYDILCDAFDIINKMLTMLDTVVDKFKQYRKDLYNKHILKHLVIKANQYIKTLCHSDTKAFEVNYLITEHKDSIHINWLIQNIDENTNSKQIISVCQASGFQRFVISLALRMSLYGNKRCEQIFIDEGFTSCDKKNLSKVPEFLKDLLQEYKGVIVMSHIDIIEENIEKKAHIIYNKNKKTSSIRYIPYI